MSLESEEMTMWSSCPKGQDDVHVTTIKHRGFWDTKVYSEDQKRWVHRWVWQSYNLACEGHDKVIAWLEGNSDKPGNEQWSNRVS